jgi:hypothetical protein
MTDPIPVLACSLSASDAADRAGRWRALLDDCLLRRDATAGGVRLEFRPRPTVAAELEALAAAERECCPFLTLRLEREEARLALHVNAAPEASDIVAAMFGAPTA